MSAFGGWNQKGMPLESVTVPAAVNPYVDRRLAKQGVNLAKQGVNLAKQDNLRSKEFILILVASESKPLFI